MNRLFRISTRHYPTLKGICLIGGIYIFDKIYMYPWNKLNNSLEQFHNKLINRYKIDLYK